MGFLSKIVSAGVKVVLTPVAVIKDTVNVMSSEPADATKDLLESASKDAKDAVDDLGDGDVL